MKQIVLCVLTGTLLALVSSCGSDDDDNAPADGLSKDITNLVPAGLLTEMKSLGMPVHEGTTPPDLTGTFRASLLELKASNIENDPYQPGHIFEDYVVTFFDQDNEKLTIKKNYQNGPESGEGIGSFISGTGNKFSVFAEIHATSGGDEARLILVTSGTMTDTGIQDLYYSLFMLDNGDNTSGYWIDDGSGRISADEDGFSEKE
ncbi:hypothetical protein [Dawidia soli]|uniref:Lipoprotein n=1 Tax=Dawidia soli TaxID=2782352 RepID=A0AAP2D8H6_9BACT|nr:hypothetical protein [Dawidia soli]MBT1687134.1 hypothetical protein [Dawidia soli]